MAKDSPYFKFYVSEYNDGDIQLCSMEAQGLFMNLCSIYWSKEGDLFLSKAKRLFKVRAKVWEQLIHERVIKVDNDRIKINFLDEQLNERIVTSKTNSLNGSKGGAPKGNKNAQNDKRETTENNRTTSEKQPKTSNKEERIEEENKEEDRIGEESRPPIKDFNWFKNQIDEIWLDQLPSDKKKNVARAMGEAWPHLFADNERLKIAGSKECKQLLNTWLIKIENKPELNGTHKRKTNSAGVFGKKTYASKL